MKSIVLVSVITPLAHIYPIFLQPIIHRHKSKVMGLIYYIKSLPYKHLSGHMLKVEAENIKWRLHLKPHFDFLVQMPFNTLYCIIFSLKLCLISATTKDRTPRVGSNSVFSCYPNFKHSKVPYLPHSIQTHY